FLRTNAPAHVLAELLRERELHPEWSERLKDVDRYLSTSIRPLDLEAKGVGDRKGRISVDPEVDIVLEFPDIGDVIDHSPAANDRLIAGTARLLGVSELLERKRIDGLVVHQELEGERLQVGERRLRCAPHPNLVPVVLK